MPGRRVACWLDYFGLLALADAANTTQLLASQGFRMAKKNREIPKPTQKRGPKPELLKLDGPWEDVAKRMITAKPPPGGWPQRKPPKPSKGAKKKG